MVIKIPVLLICLHVKYGKVWKEACLRINRNLLAALEFGNAGIMNRNVALKICQCVLSLKHQILSE